MLIKKLNVQPFLRKDMCCCCKNEFVHFKKPHIAFSYTGLRQTAHRCQPQLDTNKILFLVLMLLL